MKKLICAPMATLSHEAMRLTIDRFGGCDEYYTEMIQAGSLIQGGPFEKYYVLNDVARDKIVWQLTDAHGEKLAKATAMVAQLGGIGVDINMGCSAPDIYHQGAGIAWMIKPIDETLSMISGVRNNLPDNMRLSVKMRLGDDNFTEDGFLSFCHKLAENGVTRFVLHPRTRREKLTRPPRWEYVKLLSEYMAKEFPLVTVVLNGAVSDKTSAIKATESAPLIDGIMIGRAAVQKPWIFGAISGNLPDSLMEVPGVYRIDLIKTAFEFFDNLVKYQPPEFYKTRAQRFCYYYSTNFSFAHYLQTNLINADDIPAMKAVLESYIKEMPDDRYILISC